MITNANIKTFVQDILGCGCPEEVFQFIDCKHDVWLSSEITLKSKIIIGDRLLIYVVEAGSDAFIQRNLAELIAAGKSERDARALNRMRLVIVAANALNQQAAQSRFRKYQGMDKKIHLHIINKEQSLW